MVRRANLECLRTKAEVKANAEDTVLIGCQRIGKEIERIPKAAGGPAKIITRAGKNKSGRGALNIPGTSRARRESGLR